jgi:hypothetical protein
MNMEFLIKAALSDTLISSLQRANVYVRGVTDIQKEPFKLAFKTKLIYIEQEYANTVDDDKHIQNIQSFAYSLSQDFSNILQDGHLRLGIAQKGVNLFLKFLWSFDKIPEPPHCPIDAIVLREINNHVLWTKMDSPQTYAEIIAECRKKAGNMSLSRWELELWNRLA